MKAFRLFFLLVFLISSPVDIFAEQKYVKKSKSNICHAPNTTYYKRTKNYKLYKTLKECLRSGGRLPKR